MSPALRHNEEMAKPHHYNGSILYESKRSSLQSNDSIFSYDSLPSSPRENSNMISITGRSSKTEFLNKIKYFERKNDQDQTELQRSHLKTENHDKHIFKKTLEEVRAHFPKEEQVTVPKRNSFRNIDRPRPSLPSIQQNQHKPLKINPVKYEPVKKDEGKTLEVAKSKKPKRELSIRETVNEIRSQFAEKNVIKYSEKRSNNLNMDYLNSNCSKFFSTSDTKFLPEDISNGDKHFIILLRGVMYDNMLYSLKDINQRAHYYIHDFFDYDLDNLDIFDSDSWDF